MVEAAEEIGPGSQPPCSLHPPTPQRERGLGTRIYLPVCSCGMGSFAGPNQNSNLNDISAEQQTTCNSGVTHPGERLGLRSKGGKCISVYKTQFHKSIQGFGISLE